MKLKKLIIALMSVIAGIFLILKGNIAGEEIRNGLSVCGNILIPSLFPFMILSSFASEYNITGSFHMSKKFSQLIPVIVFGFTGGYPVGARMIAALCEKEKIDRKTADRLFLFCVNPGPAFVVNAVGSMALGSRKAGVIILISVCIASCVTGLFSHFVYGTTKIQISDVGEKSTDTGDSLVNAVNSGTSGMLSVCAWVLAFSAASGIILPYINNNTFSEIVQSLSEVTSGIPSAMKIGGIPFVAFCVSFGGLCVLCQNITYMKKSGVKVYRYLCFRLINSSLSYLVAYCVMKYGNIVITVTSSTYSLWTYSITSGISLVLSGGVLVADICDKYFASSPEE